MCCDGFEDSSKQGAGFERAMGRDRNMVRATDDGGQADMGTILPHSLIAKDPEGADKVGAVNVARNFQTASASSRTKCSRMILGIGPGAPSPK